MTQMLILDVSFILAVIGLLVMEVKKPKKVLQNYQKSGIIIVEKENRSEER